MDMLLPFEIINRTVIQLKEGETSPKYGKPPSERTVKELLNLGIVNVDKPAGPTSHQVSAYVQRILEIDKSGHSGTLDPMVTGVLPVALGKATKVVQTLLSAGKEYVCVMHLHKPVDRTVLNKAFDVFTGKIKQMPPVKSSVKRQWRFRNVYYMKILEIDGQEVLFVVGCEAGTYIRKLVHDMGQFLGCGAHMAELRRTKAGPFNEQRLYTLQDLSDAYWYYKNDGKETLIRSIIQPMENAISHLPKIWVLDTTVDTLCHGASLGIPGIAKIDSDIVPDQMIAVMTLKDELVCLAKAKLASKDIAGSPKGLAALTDSVLMETGTYPKIMK